MLIFCERTLTYTHILFLSPPLYNTLQQQRNISSTILKTSENILCSIDVIVCGQCFVVEVHNNQIPTMADNYSQCTLLRSIDHEAIKTPKVLCWLDWLQCTPYTDLIYIYIYGTDAECIWKYCWNLGFLEIKYHTPTTARTISCMCNILVENTNLI